MNNKLKHGYCIILSVLPGFFYLVHLNSICDIQRIVHRDIFL